MTSIYKIVEQVMSRARKLPRWVDIFDENWKFQDIRKTACISINLYIEKCCFLQFFCQYPGYKKCFSVRGVYGSH